MDDGTLTIDWDASPTITIPLEFVISGGAAVTDYFDQTKLPSTPAVMSEVSFECIAANNGSEVGSGGAASETDVTVDPVTAGDLVITLSDPTQYDECGVSGSAGYIEVEGSVTINGVKVTGNSLTIEVVKQ
jgi:hypothetical protein